VPEWIVLRAMKNLYNNSSKLFNACENKGIYIKDLKTLIEQELGYEETKKYRNKIDKIKFMKSLSNEHPSTELEIRFKNLFASGYENLNLVILGNPFNFHSEINLANFLIDGVKKLGAISTNEGDVAYQYIGGSILNCGGCSALFKGCKNIAGINERVSTYKILIFSRGNYNCRYPNFSLPKWAININQSRGKIYWALDECMMRTKDISNEEISILQQAELSDSDDDNLNI
jgi:hypothetical protein